MDLVVVNSAARRSERSIGRLERMKFHEHSDDDDVDDDDDDEDDDDDDNDNNDDDHSEKRMSKRIEVGDDGNDGSYQFC